MDACSANSLQFTKPSTQDRFWHHRPTSPLAGRAVGGLRPAPIGAHETRTHLPLDSAGKNTTQRIEYATIPAVVLFLFQMLILSRKDRVRISDAG